MVLFGSLKTLNQCKILFIASDASFYHNYKEYLSISTKRLQNMILLTICNHNFTLKFITDLINQFIYKVVYSLNWFRLTIETRSLHDNVVLPIFS